MVAMGAFALFAAVLGSGQGTARADPDENITICHYDRNLQGPNAGPHEITIDGSAVDMHMENHVKKEGFVGDDTMGSCPAAVVDVTATVPTGGATLVPTTEATQVSTAVPTEEATVVPTAEATAVATEEATAVATEEATAEATPTEEGPGIIVTIAPSIDEEEAVSALPPQAPIDVDEGAQGPVSAVASAGVEQPTSQVASARALPSTGSGGAASARDLTFAAMAMLAAGGGLLLLSIRLRREA